jgi:hypothetical protein
MRIWIEVYDKQTKRLVRCLYNPYGLSVQKYLKFWYSDLARNFYGRKV